MSASRKLADSEVPATIQMTAGMRDIPSQMKFRTVMMTPGVAKELLKYLHPRQRRPKENRINQYAADMRVPGRWKLTHQGVGIDVDGYVMDAQNRLEAIVLADTPVPMLLVTGVPRDAFLGTDYGANRNVADAIKATGKEFAGGGGVGNWTAAARAMIIANGYNHSISVQETINFMEVHRKALEFQAELLPRNVKGLTQAPVRGVIARAWYAKQPERVSEFCSSFLSGLVRYPKQDSGVLLLYRWLTQNFLHGRRSTGGGYPRASVVYAKTARALKAFLNKEHLEQLRETSEELFPLPGE
jgi:hypothetical protein